jgi:site-specific DNA recombinase
MALTELAVPVDETTRRRAVLYLRVSTKEQAERNGDPEGYSIPAQREACTRKVCSLDATTVAEFVDRGESARSADRSELQRMLKYLKREQIDFVVVHKLDRLARNRSDDVAITAAIAASGARLVSVTENIDETPSGILLHGIMSSIAEFYSRNLANEVLKGTQQKFKAGGTVTLAPPGYLNVRKVLEGREVRLVELDEERAPLIRWAFEAYSTGEWTLSQLALELETRGLTQRPTRKRASRPFPANKLHEILRNRYYIGYVRYRGVEVPGTHPALTGDATFAKVQAVLEDHRTSGERSYRRQHYLTGSLRCARCMSRMGYGVSRGKNGEPYAYFFCLGRHSGRTDCTLRYLPAWKVEDKIVEAWRREQLEETTVRLFRTQLMADFDVHSGESARMRGELDKQVAKVKRERLLWAEKAMSGAVPDDIARDKQTQLAASLMRLEADLDQLRTIGELEQRALDALLRLAGRCGQAYERANDVIRRAYNQAWFRYLEVDEKDSEGVIVDDAPRHDYPEALHTATPAHYERQPTERQASRPAAYRLVSHVGLSNVPTLVGVAGFEPTASSSRTKRATKLRHTPVAWASLADAGAGAAGRRGA